MFTIRGVMRVWYQEGVAAVSTGDTGSGWLGFGTGWSGMNWTQINYPLTTQMHTHTDTHT